MEGIFILLVTMLGFIVALFVLAGAVWAWEVIKEMLWSGLDFGFKAGSQVLDKMFNRI